MRLTVAFAAAATVLALTACSTPDHAGGAAAPAGSVPAAPSTPALSSAVPTSVVPTSATPTATKSPSPSKDPNVLGPTGFGALKLGMTRQQAIATGMIETFPETNGCITTRLKGAPKNPATVYYNEPQGVIAIYAYNTAMHTPEGIHLGSSREELIRAYPEWDDGSNPTTRDGRSYANVRGNEGTATYRIVTQNGKVTELDIQDKRQSCYE